MEIVCRAWYPGIGRLVDAVPELADQGVTAIEVWIDIPDHFDAHDPGEVDALVSALSSSGVRAHSIHCPFGPRYDISSLDDEVHERGVDGLIDSIEVAGMIGAGIVIVHASDRLPGSPNGRFERARGVLREMSLVAKESGIMLALENLPPSYLGHTPEEIVALLDGADTESTAVCYDTGHANLSGRFAQFTEALLPRAVTTHIHDNDGVQDQHLFPGDGSVDWHSFADTHRKCGARATIMLECCPPEGMPWNQAFQRWREALGD